MEKAITITEKTTIAEFSEALIPHKTVAGGAQSALRWMENILWEFDYCNEVYDVLTGEYEDENLPFVDALIDKYVSMYEKEFPVTKEKLVEKLNWIMGRLEETREDYNMSAQYLLNLNDLFEYEGALVSKLVESSIAYALCTALGSSHGMSVHDAALAAPVMKEILTRSLKGWDKETPAAEYVAREFKFKIEGSEDKWPEEYELSVEEAADFLYWLTARDNNTN